MENVVKQGYLRKTFPSDRGLSGLLEKIDPKKWFVLLVRNGCPYLEYYDKEVNVFTQEPINSFDLSSCKQVAYTLVRNARVHTFSVILPDRVLELASTSRERMIEWCNVIENTLQHLGILQKQSHEHVYSFCPAVVNMGRQPSTEAENVQGAAAARSPSDEEDIFGTFEGLDIEKIKEKFVKERTEQTPFPRRLSTTSEADSSDYSGDFIDGSFWERNKRLISKDESASREHGASVVNARAAGINDFLSNFRNTTELKVVEDTNNNEELTQKDGMGLKVVDDGYSELATWIHRDASNEPRNTDSSNMIQQTCSSATDCSDGNTMDISNVSCPEEGDTCAKTVALNNGNDQITENHVGALNSASLAVVNNFGSRQVSKTPEPTPANHIAGQRPVRVPHRRGRNQPKPRMENIYAPFPLTCNDSELKENETVETSPKEIQTTTNETTFPVLDSCLTVTQSENPSKPIPKRRTHIPLQPTADRSLACPVAAVSPEPKQAMENSYQTINPNFNLETFDIDEKYTTVTKNNEADSAIPPVPPRLDSLSKWASKSVDENSLKMDRNSYVPKLPPSPDVSSRQTDGPPLPPRRLDLGWSKKDSDIPPPLPGRMSQSFRIRRPITAPPNLYPTDQHHNLPTPYSKDEKPVLPERPPPRVFSQQSEDDGLLRHHSKQLSMRMKLDRSQSVHTVISLKQSQIEILQGEMQSPGVVTHITPRSCHGLALIDCGGYVWVAGWNQNDFPSLHGKFHVGDQVLSVNSVKVESVATAAKQFKHNTNSKIEIVVKRIPFSKVLGIRRSAEGESLGIKREGGTGEIIYVNPHGLAAKHGLPSKAKCALSEGTCTWYFTEINSRHLNPFFKDVEIEHRLNAVGKEISIVVQPTDFITEIKKQLKKLKHYKNFLVQ